MNDFTEWLYLHYAAPRFDEKQMPEAYQVQKAEWLACAEKLSPGERVLSIDLVNSMKTGWGERAFALGLQAGLLLALGMDTAIFPEAL